MQAERQVNQFLYLTTNEQLHSKACIVVVPKNGRASRLRPSCGLSQTIAGDGSL